MCKDARFRYRCRQCGAEFWNGQDCSEELALRTLAVGQKIAAARSDYAVHNCDRTWHSGRIGLADLIGYEIVETA